MDRIIGYEPVDSGSNPDMSRPPGLTTHNTDLMSNELLRPDCYFLLTYKQYLGMASPYDIYICEGDETVKNRVFILSAFPEFLVGYFGSKLWKTCVKHTKNRLENRRCK